MQTSSSLIEITPNDAAVLAAEIHARMTKNGVKKLKKMLSGENDYSKYQRDPVGFGREVLGEQYTDDVVRLMESVRDFPITIAVSATGTGKTHCAGRVAVWWYKVYDDSKVYTAAAPPVTNLRDLLWGEINNIAFRHPVLFAEDDVQSLLIKKKGHKDIQGEPPHLVRGLAIPSSGTPQERESKFSGKHAPQILFIFDEGDAVPDEVYAGADGGMSGGLARMLIMFNPKQKMGVPYRLIRDKIANVVELSAFNHPNVVTGDDVFPGCVTREKTVERISTWTRKLMDTESTEDRDIFEVPEFLDGCQFGSRPALVGGEKRVVEEPAFSYKVLGQYPKHAIQQLISEEWISRARVRWDAYVAKFGETPPRGTRCSIGLDAAEFGQDFNVMCCRWGGFVEKVVDGVTMWGKVDMLETGDKATYQYKKRSVIQCNVDAIGVGAGVAPHMRRLGCMAAYSVKTSEKPTAKSELGEFGTLRDQLHWEVREWLKSDPGAMLPPDEELLEELRVPTYDIINGKIKVTPKRSPANTAGVRRLSMVDILKRSPNKLDALTLTFAPKKAKARRHTALEIIQSGFEWT